jgi:hypothetical protein
VLKQVRVSGEKGIGLLTPTAFLDAVGVEAPPS